jgi:PIN domain nuclease of toxin-antitoxin system
LDTNAFLFAINPTGKLGKSVFALLENPDTERWVSSVSLWEIATKVQIGKLPLPVDPVFYTTHLEKLGARVLPLEMRHSMELFRLPLHHRDPFDRMLIAQARVEGLTLASNDRLFEAYQVPRCWD